MSSFPSYNQKLVNTFEQSCLESGFGDFMPAAMLGHFVRQIIPSSVRDNVLEMDQFYQWVRQEYSIPDHVFSRLFSRAKEDISALGYELKPPHGFDPAMDEAVRDWFRSELKEVVYADLKDEMENDIREQLRRELRPEVHRELRERFEKEDRESEGVEIEIDIDLDEQEIMEEPVPEPAISTEAANVEKWEEIPAEEFPGSLPAKEESSVEFDNDILKDGKALNEGEDAFEVFPAEELFQAGGGWENPGSAVSCSAGLDVEEHLALIKRIRSELISSVKEEVLSELSRLARLQEDKERRELLKDRLADPDYCLERIGEFLFPDEPHVFEKVKHLISPSEWQPLVLARELQSLPATEGLHRARSVIREALQVKADIEQTAFSDDVRQSQAARERVESLQGVLAEADRILDYSLQSISTLLDEKVPRPVMTEEEGY